MQVPHKFRCTVDASTGLADCGQKPDIGSVPVHVPNEAEGTTQSNVPVACSGGSGCSHDSPGVTSPGIDVVPLTEINVPASSTAKPSSYASVTTAPAPPQVTMHNYLILYFKYSEILHVFKT